MIAIPAIAGVLAVMASSVCGAGDGGIARGREGGTGGGGRVAIVACLGSPVSSGLVPAAPRPRESVRWPREAAQLAWPGLALDEPNPPEAPVARGACRIGAAGRTQCAASGEPVGACGGSGPSTGPRLPRGRAPAPVGGFGSTRGTPGATGPGPAAGAAPSRLLALPPSVVRRQGDSRPLARDGGPDRDPWLGEDKLKHFLLSFAVTSMAYGAARTVSVAHGPAVAGAASVGAAAGLWKEARDRRLGGDVSARDLAWDAVGVAAGSVVAAHTR